MIAVTTEKIFITTEIDFTSIHLSWAKVLGAKDYEIWIDSDPKWQSTSNKTNYVFKDLETNKKFIIKMRVKDNKGGTKWEQKIESITNPWSKLSSSWKYLIANNVDSIPDDKLPTKLTLEQTNDIMNLKEISKSDSVKNKKLEIKDLSPIKYFKKLTKIKITAHKITNIPPKINLLSNLKELNLAGNRIQILPPKIGSLTNLQILNLAGNYFKSLPTEVKSLNNLHTLHLSLISWPHMNYAQHVKVFERLGSLTNLQTLYLRSSNNDLVIPYNIGSLNNLQNLDLENSGVYSIPSEIGSLNNLQELNLENNEITDLPPEIGSLNNLQELNLENNEITSIPPEFGSLNNLQELNLYNNKLTSLPSEFGSLNNLQELNLYNNKLTSLPSEFGSLNKLQNLDLKDNELTSLPSEFGSLNNLQELNLYDNNLTNSVFPTVLSLTKLQTLNLGAIGITSIPPGIKALTNLKNFDLSQNYELRTVPIEINSLTNLQKLWFRHNKIHSFLPNTFTNLNQLKLLFVGDQSTEDGSGNYYTFTPQQITAIQDQVIKTAKIWIRSTTNSLFFYGTREP